MTTARTRRAGAALGSALWIALSAAVCLGHGLDPAALALRETRPGIFQVEWRTSPLRIPGADVRPALPARCRPIGRAETLDAGTRIIVRWVVDCGPEGLAGAAIGIDDLAAARINGLLSLERRDAAPIRALLNPRRPAIVVPVEPGRAEVVRRYAGLGIETLRSSPEPLLVILGLLLLAATARQRLRVVAAFTLGYSGTLSLTALGVAAVPQGTVRVLVAAGVLLLAAALARQPLQRTGLRRRAAVLALPFGMLHGFAFAFALAQAGVPAAYPSLALLSFNAGIELAVLGVVAGALVASEVLARWLPAVPRIAMRPAVYAIGLVAASWCYERLAPWLV